MWSYTAKNTVQNESSSYFRYSTSYSLILPLGNLRSPLGFSKRQLSNVKSSFCLILGTEKFWVWREIIGIRFCFYTCWVANAIFNEKTSLLSLPYLWENSDPTVVFVFFFQFSYKNASRSKCFISEKKFQTSPAVLKSALFWNKQNICRQKDYICLDLIINCQLLSSFDQ